MCLYGERIFKLFLKNIDIVKKQDDHKFIGNRNLNT